MTTGEKLQNLRKKNNYTQEDLANIMSVSRQSISKWESDAAFPETEKIITLAKLYNCSIDYLLKEDDDDPRPVEMIRKRKCNVKRLPLVLTTGGTYILFLMLCFLPWFGGIYTRTDSVYFYNTAIEHVVSGNEIEFVTSFYDLFLMIGNPFTNAQAIRVFAYILTSFANIMLIFVLLYAFIDKKPFKIIIRVGNCIFLFGLLLTLTMAFFSEVSWTPVPFVALSFSLFQVILQYAIKPIRVTR